MLTPEEFRFGADHFFGSVRSQRLTIPADVVPPQVLILFDALGEVQIVQLTVVSSIEGVATVAKRAIIGHRAVAAVLIAEAYVHAVKVKGPRPEGDFAKLPGSEEVMAAYRTWPQAGISETTALRIVRSTFGTIDLVPRDTGPDVKNFDWLTELLPQPVSV